MRSVYMLGVPLVILGLWGSLAGYAIGQDGSILSPSTGSAPSAQLAPGSPSDQVAPAPIERSLTDALGSQAGPTSPSFDNGSLQTPTPNFRSLGSNRSYQALGLGTTYVSPFMSLASINSSGRASSTGGYFGSAQHRKLQSTPEMFGDYRRPGSSIAFSHGSHSTTFHGPEIEERPQDFPTASSFSGLRISENNHPLPQDRIWVGYNHYHNAYAQPGGDLSLDRFVFGMESTIFDEGTSVELRLPVVGGLTASSGFDNATSYAGGSYGNLSAIVKHVLYSGDSCVIAGGMGIEVPTGSKSHASNSSNGRTEFSIAPAAVYLTPYLAALRTIDDIWYASGFIQVDVPTGGDKLTATFDGANGQQFLINQPSWLQLDFGGGVWLITPSSRSPLGLAATSELHIATALSEPDAFVVSNMGTAGVFVNDASSIQTVVNLTNGVHAELNSGWSLRSGVSVPLTNQRIFDTEILLQLNRSF